MTSFCKKSTLAWRGTFLFITMLCLAILTGFSTSNPASPRERPFRGTYEGFVVMPAGDPVQEDVAFTATGVATHLGRFQMANVADIDLTILQSVGTTTITAANGDELYTTYTSSGEHVSGDMYTVTGTHTITGGTGRFDGATGSFTTISSASVQRTSETVTISGKVFIQGSVSY